MYQNETRTGSASVGLRRILRAAAVTTALVAAIPANAAVIGRLSFDTPTDTASVTDAIQIFATLTLDSGSDTLTVVNGAVTEGISDSDIAAQGGDPTQGDRSISAIMTCGGTKMLSNTFIGANCNSGPYYLTFAKGAGTFQGNYSLQVGQSISLLFATFDPKNGVVPTGRYDLPEISLELGYRGVDPNGDPFFASFGNFTTDPAVFTRFVGVAAVPEPASWALMIGGFGIVGGMARRRGAGRTVATA